MSREDDPVGAPGGGGARSARGVPIAAHPWRGVARERRTRWVPFRGSGTGSLLLGVFLEAVRQVWVLTLGSRGRPFAPGALGRYRALREEIYGRRPTLPEIVGFLAWAHQERRSWRVR